MLYEELIFPFGYETRAIANDVVTITAIIDIASENGNWLLLYTTTASFTAAATVRAGGR